MKAVILAGGLPSTLIEEDEKMPKPMAEIGGRLSENHHPHRVK